MKKKVLIKVRHLKKEYQDVTPVKDINADIYKGEIICIIGPSGTGKSTFLRLLNQLEPATEGKIWLEDTEVTSPDANLSEIRKRMGMVFQSFYLFSHMNVIENIMYGLMKLKHMSKKQAYKKAMSLLDQVGLRDKALAWPEELSGGQKQRIAIARTLAMDPEIILFDEPTSALDPTMVGEVLSVIRMLSKSGITMLIVTHEMCFAREISDRIFYMDQGEIYEEGTPEQIFEHPQKPLTHSFIRQLKTARYEFTDCNFDYHSMVSGIEEFGRKQQLSPRSIQHIQFILEELCVPFLFGNFPKPYSVEIMIVYGRNDNTLNLEFNWMGKNYNPMKEFDEISNSAISGFSKNISYCFDTEQKLPNRIHVTL